jgi:hypothetical protein
MSIEESLDVTRIYSVADQLPAGTPLIRPTASRVNPGCTLIPTAADIAGLVVILDEVVGTKGWQFEW